MSEKTAVEQFAAEVLKYKNPTNLNGTDYVMIPINKLEYLIEQAKEVEKERMIKFAQEVFRNRYNQITQSLGNIANDIYNETYEQ